MHDKALLRLPAAAEFTGDKRSSYYAKIADGLLPEGISIGGTARAWPLGELQAINEARIRGASDDEIRQLVVELESARTGKRAEPRRKRKSAQQTVSEAAPA